MGAARGLAKASLSQPVSPGVRRKRIWASIGKAGHEQRVSKHRQGNLNITL